MTEYFSLVERSKIPDVSLKRLDIIDRVVVAIFVEFQPMTFEELASHLGSYPYGLIEEHARTSLRRLFEAGIVQKEEI